MHLGALELPPLRDRGCQDQGTLKNVPSWGGQVMYQNRWCIRRVKNRVSPLLLGTLWVGVKKGLVFEKYAIGAGRHAAGAFFSDFLSYYLKFSCFFFVKHMFF